MIIYYGPTMGKTTALKNRKDNKLIDFDDIFRMPLKRLSKKLNIPVKQLKIEMPIEYRKTFLRTLLITDYNFPNSVIMVSNTVALYYPDFFDEMYIPDRVTFCHRQINRSESDKSIEDLYDEASEYYFDIMDKHNGHELLTINNKFISEIYAEKNI